MRAQLLVMQVKLEASGEGGGGKRRGVGGKASIADKQRNVCNVLWQLIMRATGFLICATALWQVDGKVEVEVDREERKTRRKRRRKKGVGEGLKAAANTKW